MGRIMQEAMVATVLLLLCIYTAPSFQLPVATNDAQAASLDDGVNAVEMARKLWSDAKKLHRKLRRRSTDNNVNDDSSDPFHAQQPTDQSMSSERSGSPNVTAPKYILELYRNLSNTSQETTQANTIRTLQTISKVPKCGQYNFSLAAVNSGEFIIKAELHVYMKMPVPPVSNRGLVVVLEKYRGHHDPEIVTFRVIPSTQGEGWQVFEVQHIIQAWVNNKDSHDSRKIGFRLSVYANFDELEKKSPQDCKDAQLQFVYSSEDDKNAEHEPLLVIYSYDPTMEQVNFMSVLNELSTNTTPATTEAEGSESPTNAERKRSVNQSTRCEVKPLVVTKEHLNKIPFIKGGKVMLPDSFNAGVCGGVCSNRFPRHKETPAHASLVHVLLQTRAFTGLRYEKYQQTCSPVKYAAEEFLVRRDDGVFEIQFRHHIRITKCDCLEVYNT